MCWMYALLRPQMAIALITKRAKKVTRAKIAIQLILCSPLAKIYLYMIFSFGGQAIPGWETRNSLADG